MKSHEFANKLEKLAEFLKSRPDFDTERVSVFQWLNFYNKDKFLAAAKSLGGGRKEVSGSDFLFHPAHGISGVDFYIGAPRDRVCRKVQDEKWECEPLLTPEEEAQIAE